MSIEIKGHNPLPPASAGQSSVTGRKTPDGKPQATQATDSVSLTAAAREMNRLENQASVDHVRVAELRQAIDEQRYVIDSNSISTKFQQFTTSYGQLG